MRNLGIIMCKSGEHFAKKVVDKIETKLKRDYDYEGSILIKTEPKLFANDELKTIVKESIRNKDIFIFQDVENRSAIHESTDGRTVPYSLNDNYMDLRTTIDSVRRSDAKRINVVIPYYPYSRQDKAKDREGITAAMVARDLEGDGADRVITLDIHNEAIAGFFRKAHFENLRASKEILNYIREYLFLNEVGSPDAGGAQRTEYYAKQLGVPWFIVSKHRDYSVTGDVENMYLVGDVEGKSVSYIDDMIATAGTSKTGGKLAKDHGAKKVYFAASHGLFNGPAFDRISEAYEQGFIDGIIVGNTTYHTEEQKNLPWYKEVNLENYFAQVILNTHRGESLSKLLD
ncbi:MAG: ribose-phosphate diphosphokinase [Candidatus Woesearchaeota archaeon]